MTFSTPQYVLTDIVTIQTILIKMCHWHGDANCWATGYSNAQSKMHKSSVKYVYDVVGSLVKTSSQCAEF